MDMEKLQKRINKLELLKRLVKYGSAQYIEFNKKSHELKTKKYNFIVSRAEKDLIRMTEIENDKRRNTPRT